MTYIKSCPFQARHRHLKGYLAGPMLFSEHTSHLSYASCQIRKIAGCAYAGNAGNVFPPPWISNPDMHHNMRVTHVPWCMPGSLHNGFLWRQWWEKRSRHPRRMRNPRFYVSGKRFMVLISWFLVSPCIYLNSESQQLVTFPFLQ